MQCFFSCMISGPSPPVQDFPSVSQIYSLLVQEEIIPIFSCTSDFLSRYQNLVREIPGASAAELTRDSSNLLSIIRDEYSVSSQEIVLHTFVTWQSHGVILYNCHSCVNHMQSFWMFDLDMLLYAPLWHIVALIVALDYHMTWLTHWLSHDKSPLIVTWHVTSDCHIKCCPCAYRKSLALYNSPSMLYLDCKWCWT